MSTVNLTVNPGASHTLKFLTKDTYNPEDIEFTITGGNACHEFIVCPTASDVNNKVASSSISELLDGAIFSIQFTNELRTSPVSNTSVQLKIGSFAVKDLYWKGAPTTPAVYSTSTVIANSGSVVTVMYDGTRYQIIAISEPITTTIRTWRSE